MENLGTPKKIDGSTILPDHVCDTPVTVIELIWDSKGKEREISGLM